MIEFLVCRTHQRRDVIRNRNLFIRRGFAGDLCGLIRKHGGRHPVQLHLMRIELLLQPVGVARGCALRHRRRGRPRIHRVGNRFDRIGILAVPELIEGRRQFRHDGARRDHIQIDEIIVLIAGEILIADIAAAGDGERIVRNEQFVMHAVIDAPHVGCGGQNAGPGRKSSVGKGIEYAHLDVGVFAQMHEQAILARGIQIVDQDAHPHTAVRRQADMVQEQQR